MTVGEFFGTLQEAITVEWRKHLQTGKYSKHMALDEFYKEMPEKIDALIEAWQADNDLVKDYKNVLDENLDALTYMQTLKDVVKEGRDLMGSSELESLVDDILALIDSTIYKLKHLKESSIMSLSDFLSEMLTEATVDWSKIVGMIQKAIGGAAPAEKNRWGSLLSKFSGAIDLNDLQKMIKKNKPASMKKNDTNDSSWVGFSVEKGNVVEISFGTGTKSLKLHSGNMELVDHAESHKMYGPDYMWANRSGCRNSAYECPEDVIKTLMDAAKIKF